MDVARSQLERGEVPLRRADGCVALAALLGVRAEVYLLLDDLESARASLRAAQALVPPGHAELEEELARTQAHVDQSEMERR